jgi:hypothetical protein
MKIHLSTALILFPLAGIICWLNLIPYSWFSFLLDDGFLENPYPTPELGPIAQQFFIRGWPIPPTVIFPIHGLAQHANLSDVWLIWIFDLIVSSATIFGVWVFMEWRISKKAKKRGQCAAAD